MASEIELLDTWLATAATERPYDLITAVLVAVETASESLAKQPSAAAWKNQIETRDRCRIALLKLIDPERRAREQAVCQAAVDWQEKSTIDRVDKTNEETLMRVNAQMAAEIVLWKAISSYRALDAARPADQGGGVE